MIEADMRKEEDEKEENVVEGEASGVGSLFENMQFVQTEDLVLESIYGRYSTVEMNKDYPKFGIAVADLIYETVEKICYSRGIVVLSREGGMTHRRGSLFD
jgi:hypothetical protein